MKERERERGVVSGSVVYGRQVKWSWYPDCFMSAMFFFVPALDQCYIDGLMEPSPCSRFK